MGKYIVGVDIGGTTSKIGIFSRKNFPEIVYYRGSTKRSEAS